MVLTGVLWIGYFSDWANDESWNWRSLRAINQPSVPCRGPPLSERYRCRWHTRTLLTACALYPLHQPSRIYFGRSTPCDWTNTRWSLDKCTKWNWSIWYWRFVVQLSPQLTMWFISLWWFVYWLCRPTIELIAVSKLGDIVMRYSSFRYNYV